MARLKIQAALAGAVLLAACSSGTGSGGGGSGGAGGGSGGSGGGGGSAPFVSQLGAGYEGEGMAVVPCGTKLCVAGGVIRADGGKNADFLAARFELDATRDLAFGDQGKVGIDFDGGTGTIPFNLDVAYALTMDGDKMVLAGGARNTIGPGGGGFALARFNSNGTLDTTFSGDGLEVLKVGTSSNSGFWFNVKRLASGKYAVAGMLENGVARGNDYVVAVYNADGTPDTSFIEPGGAGFGHIADFGFTNEQGRGLVIQSTGNFVVGGGSFGVARFVPTGAVDTTFADGGLHRGGSGDLDAIIERGDGRLWLVGTTTLPNPDGGSDDVSHLKQQLLTANGQLDTSFGDGGTLSFQAPVTQVRGATLDPSGKLLVYTAGFPTKLYKLNLNGTVDTSYGSGGSLDAGTQMPLFGSTVRGPTHRLTYAGARAFLTDFTVGGPQQTFVLREVAP